MTPSKNRGSEALHEMLATSASCSDPAVSELLPLKKTDREPWHFKAQYSE